VNVSQLKSVLEIDRSLYENTHCKAITILGKPCKYKSTNGQAFCIKHTNLFSENIKED
jgi:hypothetical protein